MKFYCQFYSVVYLSSKVVVVLRLSIHRSSRCLVGRHRVLGRSLLSVKILNAFMLLLSIKSQFSPNLILFILDLPINFIIDVFIDKIDYLRIGDLGIIRLGLWFLLRNWWHRRLVVNRLRLGWNWHRWLINRFFNDWH